MTAHFDTAFSTYPIGKSALEVERWARLVRHPKDWSVWALIAQSVMLTQVK